MLCIRCKENQTEETSHCLVFERTHDISTFSGTQTVKTTEYNTGFEEAGLCAKCRKRIAFREPKILFPRAYRMFYLVWGVFCAVFVVSLILSASVPRLKTVFGVIAIVCALLSLAGLGVFELTARILAGRKGLNRAGLLVARAEKYPYKGHYSNRSYVPLGSGFYTDYASFRQVNSEILQENAEKVYERIIQPGRTVAFGEDLKNLF